MTEIDLYQANAPDTTGAEVSSLMAWAQSASAAHEIAVHLVRTSFVPEGFRGKPDEATAAILAGIEVGLQPMAALRSFDVIQGTAAPRANTLRAIVQSRGHEVWVVESTDTRAIVAGRRRGSDREQRSTWTIDRAAKLGLVNKSNWKNQPQAMLIARATSEICRLIASDAILGLPYSIEELVDGGPVDPTAPVATTATAKRTAKRASAVAAPAAVTRGEVAPAPKVASDAPPLPGDEPDPDGITAAQLKKIGALMREAGITDRTEALDLVSSVIGRDIETRNDLTKSEAHTLIEHLEAVPSAEPVDADTGEILDAEVLDPDEPSWPEAAKPGSRS